MEKEYVSLDHLNLTVKSFKESVAWYKKVFGFVLVEQGRDEDGPWGILRSGDSMLCIYECPTRVEIDDDTSERFHHMYHFGFRIRDREAWESTMIQEKLKIYYNGLINYPHSTSWYVKDPTGYMIEVVLWKNNQVKF